MYKTVEFNMIYALMSMISFVAIYVLLGGPALTINSWLGDRNQFIEPGLSPSSSPPPPSSPSPPATKPLIIKTSIFSWFQHHIKHRRKGDSARVHLVTTETKTKTHTKTNTKTKTRTFKSKSSCIYKLNHSVLQ